MSDLFSKLRTSTDPEEICKCNGAKPVKLMYALSENPIHCIDCNLEVEPDNLGLSVENVEEIASWRSVYGSIYLLWLDSDAYEAWAAEQLEDIHSPVNVRSLSLVSKLVLKRPCFFWYFRDISVEKRKPMDACPNCGDSLEHYDQGIFPQLTCAKCRIIIAGE